MHLAAIRCPLHVIVAMATLLGLVGLVLPTMAPAAVPPGFVGVNVDGPIFTPSISPTRQLDHMVSSGVESVRVVFNWSTAQPYADWKAVPVAQRHHFQRAAVPTNFAATDAIVGPAAQRGMSVLPVVVYVPGWDLIPDATSIGVPARDAPYADYLRLLVQRYGPRGSFWRIHPGIPRVPIRMWQVWNEPNTPLGWPVRPSWLHGYVHLLRAAHAAIKRADPAARVVLAGMPNYVWRDLAKLYAHGARRLFDVVAVHPYTRTPQDVITILRLVRGVMNRHGDRRKPILLTELGWPSALHHSIATYDFATTEAGQASKLAQVLPLLARDRRSLGVAGFYYYTWISADVFGSNPFSFAGLLGVNQGRVVQKPAYQVFRRGALALEGCRVKSAVATHCTKPG